MTQYLDLITSQHRTKGKFKAFIDVYAEACVDIQDVLRSLVYEFDLDTAVGKQLDAVGLWIGRSRFVELKIEGVYFTWDDTPETGWENAKWKKLGDPDFDIVELDDDTYRRLLKSKVLSNIWKGDLESLYSIFDAFVIPTTPILINDLQNMSVVVTLQSGSMPDLDLNIIKNGYIIAKPAGVSIVYQVV